MDNYQAGKDMCQLANQIGILEKKICECCESSIIKNAVFTADGSTSIYSVPANSNLFQATTDGRVNTPKPSSLFEYIYTKAIGSVAFNSVPASGVPIILSYQ